MPGLRVVSVYEPLIVHRVGLYRSVHRALCWTSPGYTPTNRACTVREFDDGRVQVAYVTAPVDCMSCLVMEARRP